MPNLAFPVPKVAPYSVMFLIVQIEFYCQDRLVEAEGKCTQDKVGKLVVDDALDAKLYGEVWGQDHKKTLGLVFVVPSTDYYCARLDNPSTATVRLHIAYQNPFGALPAEFYPMMGLTFVLLVGYAVLGIWWIERSRRYAEQLMSLQMLFTYLFYLRFNHTGHASYVLMAVVAMLSAVRASMSLFLTLIVSMGYGTVKADLEGNETLIYSLTLLHALLNVLNVAMSLASSNRSGPLTTAVALPLAATNTVFFLWTLGALRATKADLETRKQRAKLAMYERFTRALDILFFASAALTLISLMTLIGNAGTKEWMSRHWKSFWFLADGWSTLMIFGACVAVAWLWRPRENNRTFGLDELATEDGVILDNLEKNVKQPKVVDSRWNEEGLNP